MLFRSYWRRRAVDTMASAGFEPGDTCLDLCSGTGDMALNVARRLGGELDFVVNGDTGGGKPSTIIDLDSGRVVRD